MDSLPLNHLGVSDREGTSDNSVTLGTDFVAMGNNVINENQNLWISRARGQKERSIWLLRVGVQERELLCRKLGV